MPYYPPAPGQQNNPLFNPGYGVPQAQPQLDITQPPGSFDQSQWTPAEETPQDRFYRNQQQEAWNNFAAQSGMLPHQIEAQRRFGREQPAPERDRELGHVHFEVEVLGLGDHSVGADASAVLRDAPIDADVAEGRVPDLDVSGPSVPLESAGVPLVTGIKRLPVRFTPTARVGTS